ncbi:hypothetical protein KA005_16810 [bacterium]|nr:hypothetical protein [bacterium]
MNNRKRLQEIIKGNKLLFKPGDKIHWTYRHALNSKSSTLITKYGLFLRYVTSNYKDGGSRGTHTIFCYVQFEGNKNPSKIRIDEMMLNID